MHRLLENGLISSLSVPNLFLYSLPPPFKFVAGQQWQQASLFSKVISAFAKIPNEGEGMRIQLASTFFLSSLWLIGSVAMWNKQAILAKMNTTNASYLDVCY